MPKSRVRKKSVYTPPPRTAKAKFSPPWLAPTMLAALLIGLAWIAVFYVTGGSVPGLRTLGTWNLVVGFGFIIFGVALSTRWRSQAHLQRCPLVSRHGAAPGQEMTLL